MLPIAFVYFFIIIFSSRVSITIIIFLWFLSLLNSFCSCVVFLISLNCLSGFSYSSLNFVKTDISNYLLGKWWISISMGSVTRKLLCSSGGILFPWFFMFLEVLHCWLLIWRSTHLLQCFLPVLGREIPSFNSVRGPEAFLDLFYGHAWFIVLLPSCGKTVKIAYILPILHS